MPAAGSLATALEIMTSRDEVWLRSLEIGIQEEFGIQGIRFQFRGEWLEQRRERFL